MSRSQPTLCPPSLNFGRAGDFSADVLARISDAVAAECGAYMVMVGINDLNSASNPSAATVIANIRAIWDALLATGLTEIAREALDRIGLKAEAAMAHAAKRREQGVEAA